MQKEAVEAMSLVMAVERLGTSIAAACFGPRMKMEDYFNCSVWGCYLLPDFSGPVLYASFGRLALSVHVGNPVADRSYSIRIS